MANVKRKRARRRKRINIALMVVLALVIVGVVGATYLNIRRVNSTETGNGTTIETETEQAEYSNDYYTIGNNPTDTDREYFQELNDAVASGDNASIAQAVVKNFISEYYTWTNKDGNYDIGGMQFIMTEKQADFEKYTRYNFYQDLDLYITQIGTKNLIQVKDVTINDVEDIGAYTIEYPMDESEVTDETDPTYADLPCYQVYATWNYEDNSSLNTAEFQSAGTFYVVNNNGRMEIAGIEG